MSKKIKVWGRATSSNVKKVLWVCDALRLDIERVDAGGKFGVVDTPAYRNMNPNGRIPTLEEGDFVLWESNAIMRYLCESYGGETLYPLEPKTRADINRWLDWSLSILSPADTKVFLATIRTPEAKQDKAEIAKLVAQAATAYEILDRRLEDREYVAGKFSIGDIALSIFVDRWMRNPFLATRPEFSHNAAWLARVRDNHAGFRRFVEIPLE
ncbi:MAG TPA: glutathione S-transferase N-terminal domain-containing protein [Xanthobacteraceae bacterium]|nr:glutathione S-transferase N-terminal domain-containing protein [Xanthobacteraceae bacterium]